MPVTLHRPTVRQENRVRPSIVDAGEAQPYTLEQELKPFGAWIGEPIAVPPKDSSVALAESMLQNSWPFASMERRWEELIERSRGDFTQVREIYLFEPSIRLPKGRFFVNVTEQQDFDTIAETIPACVQARLDEFLAGPGKRRGVKVYYLKPLCVDFCDELILTTRQDLDSAINKIKQEVIAEYHRSAPIVRTAQAAGAVANAFLALPRRLVNHVLNRQKRALDAYQAKLEFERRKTALNAAQTHQKLRTDPCTFDDMLALTSPLRREDVIEQYCIEEELTHTEREQLLQIAADALPWFVTLSLTAAYLATVGLSTASPIMLCDPAFVAEMPGSDGMVLKIGHFDEVRGVTHVEI